MRNIHRKNYKFGHLDFSNVYFVENKTGQKELAKHR